jgi:hypothetical protein
MATHKNQQLPSIIPTRELLQRLIIDLRHLQSALYELRDTMPRSQKSISGIYPYIIDHTNKALHFAITAADYAYRHEREALLRRINVELKTAKEFFITAHEREYIKSRTTFNHISANIHDISGRAVSYAKGLEDKRTKKSSIKKPSTKTAVKSKKANEILPLSP